MSDYIEEYFLSVSWPDGEVTCTDHPTVKDAELFGRDWIKDGASGFTVERNINQMSAPEIILKVGAV